MLSEEGRMINAKHGQQSIRGQCDVQKCSMENECIITVKRDTPLKPISFAVPFSPAHIEKALDQKSPESFVLLQYDETANKLTLWELAGGLKQTKILFEGVL